MPYRATELTRRTAERRRETLLAAARHLVAGHGFAAATVAAIAQEAGVSVGSVYSHFDSREYLLAEVFRSAAAHELAAVRTAVADAGPRPADRLDALVRTFAGRALQGPRMAWALLFEPVTSGVDAERLVFRRSYTELGEQIVHDGIAEGVFVEQDVVLAASAVMGAISEALVDRLRPLGPATTTPTTDHDVITGIRSFCFRALGAEELQ
ncbi:TetR/AcrR family transcriptional regulator [Blastococcus sp. SYSU DS0552]